MCKYHWRRSGSRFILEQFHSELITTSWYFPLHVYWNLLKDQIFVRVTKPELWISIMRHTRSRVLFICLFVFLSTAGYVNLTFLYSWLPSPSPWKKNLKSLSQRRCFNFPRGDWCREVHVTQFHPMRCERSLPGVFVGMISLRMKIGLSNNCLCFFR